MNSFTSKAIRKYTLAFGIPFVCALPAMAFDASDVLIYTAGPVTLRPQAGLAETFNDNFAYRASTNQLSDFITTVSAGLKATLGNEALHTVWTPEVEDTSFVTLEYGMDYNVYADHDQFNEANHNFEMRNLVKGNKLTLSGRDRAELATEFLSGGFNLAQQVSYTKFSDIYRLDYQTTEKTALYLSGEHQRNDFEKDTPLYNNNSLRGTLGFQWNALPKTSFFGEVYYGQFATSPNRTNFVNSPYGSLVGGFLGAKGKFTDHFSGMVKVGYEAREFGDGTPVPSSPVVEMGLTYNLRSKTAVNLLYRRYASASIQASKSFQNFDIVSLRLDQKLGSDERLRAFVSGTYYMANYETGAVFANREDTWYQWQAGLSYVIKMWMTTSLVYQGEMLDSTHAAVIDYQVNRIMLKLDIGY